MKFAELKNKISNEIPGFKKTDFVTFTLFWAIIAIFLLKIIVLFIFPIPEYIHDGDVPFHIKRIELIKKDISYIGYENYYPKGFHILAALLSFIIPTGTAVAIITLVFSFLFVLFSYKLAFKFSNDKFTALLTSFLALTVGIYPVTLTITSPLPQTLGLTLMVMELYFFSQKKYLLTGLLFGFHAITHFSWSLSLLLLGIYFLLHEKKSIATTLQTIPTIGAVALIAGTYTIATNFFSSKVVTPLEQSINFYGAPDNYLALHFVDNKISPLMMHAITNPPFLLALPLAGLWLYRKQLGQNKKFLATWLFILLAITQSYWLFGETEIIGNTPFTTIFIGSRMLTYAIFPVAFLSAIALNKLKENKNRKYILTGIIILLLIMAIPAFDKKPYLTQKELGAIRELKEKPIDGKVIANDFSKGHTLALLSLKTHPTQVDYYLLLSGLSPIYTNKIDYVLIDKNSLYEIHDLAKKQIKFSSPLYGTIEIKHKYQTNTNLQNHVAAFFAPSQSIFTQGNTAKEIFFKNEKVEKYGQKYLKFWPLKIQSTDTGEEICITNLADIGKPCGQIDFNDFITLKAKKQDLVALFDNYDNSVLHNKLFYLYGNGRISFEPEVRVEYDGEEYSMEEFSEISKWVNFQQPLSLPNFVIGKIIHGIAK